MGLRRRLTTRLPRPVTRAFSAAHRVVLRRSSGRVAARFRGNGMLLLTTTGRRSGQPRTWPLLFLDDGGYVVAGSNGGHDRDPAWCLNLRARPDAVVEVDGRRVPVRARFTDGDERERRYAAFAAAYRGYADYAQVTDRIIPVVVLEPRDEVPDTAWVEDVGARLAAALGTDPATLAVTPAEAATLLELAGLAARASGARTNAPLLCHVLGRAVAAGTPLEDLAPVVRGLVGR